MGVYTELNMAVELNLGEKEIKILQFMTRENLRNDPDFPIPNHPFFQTERWDWMLRAGGSYYFPYPNRRYCDFYYDDIAESFFLNCRVNFKNYGSEIEKFIDWLSPYVDKTSSFVGHIHYEEWVTPQFILYDGEKLNIVEPLVRKPDGRLYDMWGVEYAGKGRGL
jgi:hypothetical protein